MLIVADSTSSSLKGWRARWLWLALRGRDNWKMISNKILWLISWDPVSVLIHTSGRQQIGQRLNEIKEVFFTVERTLQIESCNHGNPSHSPWSWRCTSMLWLRSHTALFCNDKLSSALSRLHSSQTLVDWNSQCWSVEGLQDRNWIESKNYNYFNAFHSSEKWTERRVTLCGIFLNMHGWILFIVNNEYYKMLMQHDICCCVSVAPRKLISLLAV